MLTFAVLSFGTVNLLLVGRVSYRALTLEQSRRLSFAAGLLARRAVDPILRDDRLELNALLDESVGLDPDLAYVVVSDPRGAVLAHTFNGELPQWVFSPELVADDREREVLFQSEADGAFFRELAEPILDGKLGVVRVGLDESGARSQVKSLLSTLAAMVAIFLTCGIGGTVWVTRRITRPLIAIVDAVKALDLSENPASIDVATGDEIEVLADHVQSMTRRLWDLYRTERDRERGLARVERLAALGTLTAGLAHELNNPLAGIKSAAQRLPRMPADSERVAQYASVIEDAARRMERVLKGTVDFSRPQEVHLERTSVRNCVASAIDLSEARLRRSCIAVEIPEGLPEVLADPDLLVQVILNIMLNAADSVEVCDDHSECDGPRIFVAAKTVNDSVVLRISDTGPGVPEELREKIFDPFFTSKPAGKGTGLGLSTAWSLMREMGGDLSLEADSKAGACFAIRLQSIRKVL